MKLRKKYRVFIFQPYPKFGGADRSIIRLINGNKIADFTLVSLTKCNYSKYLNKKIEYLEIKSSRVLFSFFKLREKIKNTIYRNEYDKNIFISNQNFANVISILALNKLKNLKTILIERNHLDELKNYKNIIDFLKKKIIFYLIKYNYKKANLVIGISKELSNDLSKFINRKVTNIYNPALDENIYKKRVDKIIIDKRILKKRIILNVGFFEMQKDQITILKAFNDLKKDISNIHLILIGKGSKLGYLKRYIHRNNLEDSVSLITNVNNPEKYYKISKLFVLSSRYEGFGNVIVEALKNNCPVITSNCKSGPMEIIDYGNYGDYFEIGDYAGLKNKMRNFFLNEKKLKNKTLKAKYHLQKFNLINNKLAFDKVFNKI